MLQRSSGPILQFAYSSCMGELSRSSICPQMKLTAMQRTRKFGLEYHMCFKSVPRGECRPSRLRSPSHRSYRPHGSDASYGRYISGSFAYGRVLITPPLVYCYYAESTYLHLYCLVHTHDTIVLYIDTVERNILDLAAKRGLSLYTKGHATGTVKVTSFEMDQNGRIDSLVKNGRRQRGQKGDFIFK